CPINWSTLMVRRSLPIRFPLSANGMADQLYAVELVRQGRVTFAEDCLAGYRRHATNMTANPRMSMARHDAIEEWLRGNLPTLAPSEADRIRVGSLHALLECTQAAKWHRDWPTYWALRDYLAAYRDDPSVAAALASRPLPRWVYALKDRVWAALRFGPR